MGVVRLMDMMAEREVVRNEALLLMIVLTHANAEVQKIAAFEGAFERLFSIIRSVVARPHMTFSLDMQGQAAIVVDSTDVRALLVTMLAGMRAVLMAASSCRTACS
jgi:hypothetical protein